MCDCNFCNYWAGRFRDPFSSKDADIAGFNEVVFRHATDLAAADALRRFPRHGREVADRLLTLVCTMVRAFGEGEKVNFGDNLTPDYVSLKALREGLWKAYYCPAMAGGEREIAMNNYAAWVNEICETVSKNPRGRSFSSLLADYIPGWGDPKTAEDLAGVKAELEHRVSSGTATERELEFYAVFS